MKPVRCAIYTRKSSEEGLDQAFNSLDAQREACEAYIVSQAGEGWVALPGCYDDGGYSGGNIDRPALACLLEDVQAGKVDTIVVYKIDRLTRSLGDFSKIVDKLDAAGCSFVSVTQAFNTTTSMGRLTLNVLLSFAQFEREVTGERIRDKIAASKKKGMWMGGIPPLGYDCPAEPGSHTLAINEGEAATVRSIFDAYLRIGSVGRLTEDLKACGVLSKAYVTRRGATIGGAILSRGAVFHILRNSIYVGEISHKGTAYLGSHTPILERAVFDAVQEKLQSQRHSHRVRPLRSSMAKLKGILFDADGHPMSPTFTHGAKGAIHRYYVSAPLMQGARLETASGAIRRTLGTAVDDVVIEAAKRLVLAADVVSATIKRVQIFPQSVHLLVKSAILGAGDVDDRLAVARTRLAPGESVVAEGDGQFVRFVLPIRLQTRGGRRWLQGVGGPVRAKVDSALVKGLKLAHRLAKRHGLDLKDSEQHRVPSDPYERRVLTLAFLAPDIQQAILEGRQPATLTLERLTRGDLPSAWADQRVSFGF